MISRASSSAGRGGRRGRRQHQAHEFQSQLETCLALSLRPWCRVHGCARGARGGAQGAAQGGAGGGREGGGAAGAPRPGAQPPGRRGRRRPPPPAAGQDRRHHRPAGHQGPSSCLGHERHSIDSSELLPRNSLSTPVGLFGNMARFTGAHQCGGWPHAESSILLPASTPMPRYLCQALPFEAPACP